MKIGIITFHAVHNYGAVLQAHATQQTLNDIGHEAVLVNLAPPHLVESNRKKVPVRSLKTLALNLAMIPFRGKLATRYRRFEQFRASYLETTRLYESYEAVEEDPPEVDLFLVGSDQVWNMETGGNPLFFLRFLKGTKPPVITYAPSFGTAEIPEKYEDRFIEWAGIYDFLSVRESSGKVLAERLLGRQVTQVLDPIFLRSAEYWKEVAGGALMKKPYLAFYSLEATGVVSDCLVKLARHLNLPVVVLGKPGPFMLKCRTVVAIDAGPREFLSWIAHADFVVTNSFHATAFSALFEVPYATIAHSTRNARMESLLEILNQQDRIVNGPGDLTPDRFKSLVAPPEALDSDITGRFVRELQASREFLEESLAAAVDAHRSSQSEG